MPKETQMSAGEQLHLRKYLNAEISLGEFKEALGMRYIDDILDWLHRHGIPGVRKFRNPNLEAIAKANFEKLEKEILP